jgi:hypothetical protein
MFSGVWTAANYYFANDIARARARDEAQARGETGWALMPMSAEDRLAGEVFGFGIAYLGAFGTYALLKRPD